MDFTKSFRSQSPDPLAPRPAFSMAVEKGQKLYTGNEARADDVKDGMAWAREASHRRDHHVPAPHPGAAPGPFDTRTPKVTCGDLKLAEAVWRSSGEHHHSNLPTWQERRREKLFHPNAARAEVVRSLDILVERPPPIHHGVTSEGGAAADRATSPSRREGVDVGGGARALGGGRSIPAWDAYSVVSAPFASAAVVLAPESGVAQAVLSATTSSASAAPNPRPRRTAGPGSGVDFRDEHTVHALAARLTAAGATHAQRALLASKGLPVGPHLEVDPATGQLRMSRAAHPGAMRRVAHDPSNQHHPPRFDVYENVTRGDMGIKPDWVQHTSAAESDRDLSQRSIPVRVEGTTKFLRATSHTWMLGADASAGGPPAQSTRVRLRVWSGPGPAPGGVADGKEAEATANPSATTVLDDPTWQRQFAARTLAGATLSGVADGVGLTDATVSGSRAPSRGASRAGSGGGGGVGGGASSVRGGADFSEAPLSSSRGGGGGADAFPVRPSADFVTGAPSIADDLSALLEGTAGATGISSGSPVPGEPGTSIGERGTLRHPAMSPIAIDRRAASATRGPSRQRVHEYEDAGRFPPTADIDVDSARALVTDVLAPTHPFVAQARRVAQAAEIQARRANLARAERAETVDPTMAAAQTARGIEGGARTMLLATGGEGEGAGAVGGSGSQQQQPPPLHPHPFRSTTLEAVIAVPRPGTVALPGSQQPPSRLRQTRGRVSAADPESERASRTVRTSHGAGTGAPRDHVGWEDFMARSLSAPRSFISLGALRVGTDYAFPIRLRNLTLFTRRFRVAAAGVEDTPAAPRATLRVRHKTLPIPAGLSFTVVVLVKGLEAGALAGHVHLTADDGQNVHLRFRAHLLEPSRFDLARDDARATGKLVLLSEFTARIDAVASEWDATYRTVRTREASPERGDGEESAPGPLSTSVDPAAVAAATALLSSVGSEAPYFVQPQGAGAGVGSSAAAGAPLTGRRDDEMAAQAARRPGPGGVSNMVADRAHLSVAEAGGDAEAKDGGGDASGATATLLRLTQQHGTTPAELLAEAVAGGSKKGPAGGATATAEIVAAALAEGRPLFVGTRAHASASGPTADEVPYPSATSALAAKALRLQDRAEAIRGKLIVGQAEEDGGSGGVGAPDSLLGGGDSVRWGATTTDGGGGPGSGPSLAFTTHGGRTVQRVGPATSKYSDSTLRGLAEQPSHGPAPLSSLVLPAEANDFMVPHGGTHPLVVPIV
jgi:hypothetical protein